jgi:hypothetical protein
MSLSKLFRPDATASHPHSGYTALDFQHQCDSSFRIGTDTVVYKNPSQAINGNWVTTNPPSTVTYIAALATSTSYWTVFGDGIPIWYQASDQVAFTASQISQSSSATSTSSPSTLTSTSSPTSALTGLSTGAKVGIGVGVAGGIIALATIASFFIFRRRKRYHAASTDAPIQELQSTDKSEFPGLERPVVHELYSDDGDRNTVSPGRHELYNQ